MALVSHVSNLFPFFQYDYLIAPCQVMVHIFSSNHIHLFNLIVDRKIWWNGRFNNYLSYNYNFIKLHLYHTLFKNINKQTHLYSSVFVCQIFGPVVALPIRTKNISNSYYISKVNPWHLTFNHFYILINKF